jgi:hypothetical protein
MDIRRVAIGLALLLMASGAKAEDKKEQTTAAKLQILEGQISDPDDFKSYVEGSLRIPGAALAPKTQVWSRIPGLSTQGRAVKPMPLASGPEARTPLVPAQYRQRPVPAAPGYAYRSRSSLPTSQDLPPWPVSDIALTALAIAGLFAFASKKEFEVPAAAPAAAVELPPAPDIAQLTDTPAVRNLLGKLDAPIEPFIDTRMPVPTWRAISWREQLLIDMWDSSFEKTLGQPFTEWLDAQEGIAGADAALLKSKLERQA